MRHNVPVECAAELCGVTRKTAFEWRLRVLATVSGYQDRVNQARDRWDPTARVVRYILMADATYRSLG